jgi:ABC-type amino acid transport substrate-binding protein
MQDSSVGTERARGPRGPGRRRGWQDRRMSEPGPQTDHRHPADVVTEMVDQVLELAMTWTRWEGTPFDVTVDGEVRRYTPHKAIRRVTDHLIDHLAEIEARAAGRPTEPDTWHGSFVTTPADLADFTADDLDEATSRLRRLAQLWDVRLRSLTDQQLDAVSGRAWTPRQVAFHVAGSRLYADSVGSL